MPGPGVILREIHRLRRHAKDLQNRIEQMPRQLKLQQGTVARQEELLREAQEVVKRLKVKIHEEEVSLKATLTQVAKHEKQLNDITSKKEYDALKAEIATERGKVSKLEDAILGAMGEAEERAAQLPELEKAVREAKKNFTEFERGVQGRQDALAEEHRQSQQKLAEVEATLPQDELRTKYEREIRVRGEDALSGVQGRTCLACYTEITAQHYNELQQDQFVLCISCGRILYRAE